MSKGFRLFNIIAFTLIIGLMPFYLSIISGWESVWVLVCSFSHGFVAALTATWIVYKCDPDEYCYINKHVPNKSDGEMIGEFISWVVMRKEYSECKFTGTVVTDDNEPDLRYVIDFRLLGIDQLSDEADDRRPIRKANDRSTSG